MILAGLSDILPTPEELPPKIFFTSLFIILLAYVVVILIARNGIPGRRKAWERQKNDTISRAESSIDKDAQHFLCASRAIDEQVKCLREASADHFIIGNNLKFTNAKLEEILRVACYKYMDKDAIKKQASFYLYNLRLDKKRRRYEIFMERIY